MNFLRTVFIEKLYRFPHLCASYNAVIYKQKLLSANQFRNRNQFHFCNTIPHGLICRHKASRPCRGVLDKRSSKRNSALIGIANGMGNAGIRNTANKIHVRKLSVFHIRLCHDLAVSCPHQLHVYALVAGSGISIVCPEERTDFHLIGSLRQNFVAILC